MDVWVTVMRPVGWAQSGVLVSDNSPLTQEKSTFFFSISSLSIKCWFLNGTSDAYPFGCCAERLNSTLHITEESIHSLLTASFPAFENGAHKEAGPVTAHQESIVHSPTNVKTRNWSHISVARKHLSSIRSYVV